MGPQIFHRDRDDFRACKLFFYLSDVGPDNGPHIFVRSSHNFESVCSRFPNLSETDVRSAFFMRNGRELKTGVIESLFGDQLTEITGPAGTSFLEVTYGWHRGKVPTGGERMLFQVLYGVTPFVQRVKKMRLAAFDRFPADVRDCAETRHALRFLLPQ